MVLSVADIKEIIKKRPNKALIDEAIAKYQLLRMHCTGEGISEFVEDIPEFMRPGMKDTLVNLMRSNRDLIYRVMSPRDKIYTAKGGIEQYNLPENVEAEFREYLSSIADGLPVKEWVRQRLQKHYDYDPNGVVFIEISADGTPYPTIRCIEDIFDYRLNGRAVDYLIFQVTEAERNTYEAQSLIPSGTQRTQTILRVIDDTTDRIIILGNRSSTAEFNVISEIPNEFGYVPAIIISDIYGYGETMDSPLSPSIELLNAYMISGGTYNLAYMRQAFPKEWMQLSKCPTCSGQKEIQGNPCPECKGSGILPYMKQSDVVLVDYRTEDGKNVPNPPMGVVAPAVEALQFMADNGMTLENYIDYTQWGVSRVQATQKTAKVAGHGGNVSNTAYEAQLNEQPKFDQLKKYSAWKDSIQKFIADTCGWYLYRQNYEGCAILGGDRYMIESPDATWDRYTKAVASKAPMAILDSLLMEYIENKYNNNPLLYRKYKLLMQVEPFVHEDVAIIWVDQTLPMIVRLEKKYYDEWTSTLEDYDIASVPDEGGADILREELRQWVMGKYVDEKKQDNLLLTNTGQILNIGDTVKVRKGMEQKPQHVGQEFTVTDISDMDVTLSGGGMDAIFGYKMTDLETPNMGVMAVDGTNGLPRAMMGKPR